MARRTSQGIFIQWQDGKQVCIWPHDKCPNKMEFPSFLKVQQQASK